MAVTEVAGQVDHAKAAVNKQRIKVVWFLAVQVLTQIGSRHVLSILFGCLRSAHRAVGD